MYEVVVQLTAIRTHGGDKGVVIAINYTLQCFILLDARHDRCMFDYRKPKPMGHCQKGMEVFLGTTIRGYTYSDARDARHSIENMSASRNMGVNLH